ncbi:MAG: LysM peptidoglycan-binding domain-containing protein [candidate division Zixibacteria bacterium]|nr:LysM peptidoglycan-binding domain-containing protein [candidate division Zixibacteria bacterium]
MKKRKFFLLFLIFIFFLTGCSKSLIKPRVVNPPPQVESLSGEPTKGVFDSSLSEEVTPRDEFEEVELHYARGVAANQEGRWLEAQDHFEEALELLANLDIEEGDSLRELKFEKLLNEIAEDYKITLLGLGVLSGESSISAFLQRFQDIENFKALQKGTVEKIEPVSEEVTYDMPIEWNQRVENSIIYFQTVAREAIETYLKRSGKYKDLMQSILREKGLPEDLVWLCLVESGFNPKAYSWARAVGPWQFIASTGRKYGLRRNWWYDERRDFVKSTYAACDYLTFLYNKFKSWPLALAGYNGGEGRVGKAIKKHKTNNFWKLKLNRQTANYVPLYMAATIIAKEPERYGFDVEYDEPIRFDEVMVNQPVDLKKVARSLGSSFAILKQLNPELRRGVTPPNYPGYQLRIPAGTKKLFAQKFKGYNAKTSGLFVEHKVRKGQTLSHLSHRYGVPISAIMELNGLTNKHRLSIGQRLIIPSNKRIAEKSASKVSSKKGKKERSGSYAYTVKKGDTLSKLALKFNTTPGEIKRVNGLKNPHRISLGQKLRIPETNLSSGGLFKEHIVKRGENLSYLAKKYGISVSAIMAANHLTSKHILKIGQRLLIPASSDVTLRTYIVKKGDTVSDLALRFGSNTGEIKKLNGLTNPHSIKKGQKLKIPTRNGGGGKEGTDGRWIIYVVKRGDSLWEIAKAFGVLMEKLIRWNNLVTPSRLQVGDEIRIFRTN